MYSHILIPTDGSDVARKGVDHGLSLAKTLGAKVTVLIVTEPYPLYSHSHHFMWAPGAMDVERYEKNQNQFAEMALEPVRAAADKLGVEIETVHRADEYPSEAIVKVATERNCALIVMASHGRRALQRLFLGSQTLEVLQHTTIPVLVVR